ncbi:MAG: hypothetical protein KDK97_10560 [Verrucomicrobiales bacterium]|nr:hypothetical protein [Verrucomicrobiales bacterium]
MKLQISLRSPSIKLFAALGLLAMAPVYGGTPSSCDDIAEDVRSAISKDPGKTLMVVEDALVINESCACEIVKAAIDASHADPNLVQQIVQTAIAVAPKMSAVITECAGVSGATAAPITAAATDSEKNAGGKAGVSVQPAPPVIPPSDGGSEGFSYIGPRDIRGVYLVQPAASGFGGFTESHDEEPTKGGGKGGSGSKVVRRHTHVPTSPSCTCP